MGQNSEDTYYELARRSIPIFNKNHETTLSCRDSVITVRTDKGLSFIDFSYNLECFFKDIDIVESSISSPKTSPAAALCKSRFINNEMKNYDYTEMLMDDSFWPHNSSLTEEMTHIIQTAWSPPNFIENRSVLSILNNIGGVEMYTQQQYKWKCVLDLSPYILEYLEHNRSPRTFEELKKSVYIVETCSICWAPELNPDHSCYFVTAQKDGFILIWQIFNSQPPILKEKIQLGMSEIKNMLWVPRTQTMFWLLCADIQGMVNVFAIETANSKISLDHLYLLWDYKDRMIASYLQYMKLNDEVIFFYAKYRHVVVQVVDDNCKILTQYINNVNDYRITDISASLNGYYVSTINFKIYKLNISLFGHTLSVELIPVAIKEPYSSSELYSLCFSHSNIFCVLGAIDRKLLCRKEVLKINVIFLSTDAKLNSIMPIFLNNPTKKLTHYWDCIEALRYNIIKTRTMPALNYNLLYTEGSNEIYNLKIYLFLLIFYLNRRKMAQISSDFTLPELSVDVIKEKILLLHAQSNIETTYKKYEKSGELTMFEKESLFGSINYLEYCSKSYKTEVAIDKNILTFGKKTKFEYVCQSCDCKISDSFMCDSGHLNMYCMLSFVPISNDNYLFCKSCNSTAHVDSCIDNFLCVFCDQCLVKSD